MGGILEESCPDLDGDGEPDWKVDIYDISDAASPTLVGEFLVPEMEVGTLVLNGEYMRPPRAGRCRTDY